MELVNVQNESLEMRASRSYGKYVDLVGRDCDPMSESDWEDADLRKDLEERGYDPDMTWGKFQESSR